jgi:AcrR family transcriptional regulator
MVRKKTASASPHVPVSGQAPQHVRVRRNNAEDAERMRERLAAAALRLFSEGGLDAVSMRAVAAQVGVSAMAAYRYFEDKADLLSSVWQDILADVHRTLEAAVKPFRDPRDRERAASRALFKYWEDHPDEHRLIYVTQGTPQRRDVIAPAYRELMHFYRRLSLDLARHIGADEGNVAHADEMRMIMLLGYFGALVNRRYPWSDFTHLREAFVEQTRLAVEHSLSHGRAPEAKPTPRRAVPRQGTGGRFSPSRA